MLRVINLCVFFMVLSLSLWEPTTAADWQTMWRDDFNGQAGTFPSEWQPQIGTGWGNNQVEHDTGDPNNVSLDGKGNLKITALRDDNGRWTSARIVTNRDDFRPPPGGKMALEGRMRLPDVTGDAALGYWPAFWALGSGLRQGKSWPGVGEIDVMENINGRNEVYGTFHCGVTPGGPCNEGTGLGNHRACPDRSCVDGFHIYRAEWDESSNPKEIRFYVDGQLYNTVTSSQVSSAWDQIESQSGFFLILNLAIGGNFPNGVAGQQTPTPQTQSGHSLLVDYVAVFTSI